MAVEDSHTGFRPGPGAAPAGRAYLERMERRMGEKRVDRDDDEEGEDRLLQAMVLWRTAEQRRTGTGSKPVPGERRDWHAAQHSDCSATADEEEEDVNADAEDAKTICSTDSFFHEFH